MVKKVKVDALHCVCDECGHPWETLAKTPPRICASCKSPAWNGRRKVGRPAGYRDTSKAGLPKPTRKRTLHDFGN